MDVGEVVVKIRATADGLEDALDSGVQKIQQFGKAAESVAAKQIHLEVKSDSLDKVRAGMDDLSNSMQEASRPVTIKINAPAVQDLGQGIQALKADLGDLSEIFSDLSITGFEDNFAAIDKNLSDAAKALEDGNTRLAETLTKVASGQMDQLLQVADHAVAASRAVEGVGAAGMAAGTQSAIGMKLMELATAGAERVAKRLKATLTTMATGFIMGAAISAFNALLDVIVKSREESEKFREEQRRANKEAIEGSLKSADEHRKNAANIRTMANEYVTLARKKRTASEDNRFLELENELAIAMGTTGEAIRAQAASIDVWTEAINKAAGAETKKVLGDMREATRRQAEIVSSAYGAGDLKEGKEAYKELASMMFENILQDMRDKEEPFSESLGQLLKSMLLNGISSAGDSSSELSEFINSQLDVVRTTLTNADIGAGMEGFSGLVNKVFWGEMSPEDAAPLMAEQLNNIQQAAYNAFVGMGDSLESANEKAIAFRDAITGGEQDMLAYARGVQETARATELAARGFGELAEKSESVKKSIADSKNLTNNVKAAKDAVSAYKNLSKEMKKNPAEIEKVNKAMGKLGQTFDGSEDSLNNAEKGIKSFEDSLRDQADSLRAEIADMEAKFAALGEAAYVDGVLSADAGPLLEAIATSKDALSELLTMLKAAGLSTGSGKGGGGGGGGKKDDAAAEAERARKEALQRDYDLIAHKRHMNQITLEMELSMLQRIRQEHKLTAEEIMAWEEKVYDVKQEIRARDAGSLDTIGDALITALTARYQAMLDAETERLDTSRRAWEDWRDGSVKAIQDQIDALDALAKTEDREKQDQEELRKIAKLRQDIEFEQDEYNRMKLSQQLEQAMESREERLRRLALEDAKDALRAEMAAIEERAEAELKALDEEQAAIEKAYAEQMKSAAIQAEAEKLLMANNQQELISLIGEYAPEYNALGKTLGEKLLDGFKQKTADVVKWFESLNKQLYAIQEAAAAEAIAASNALYAAHAQNQSAPATEVPAVTTVNQTVNFNEPVDSAGENARKLQRVNEELGAILNG